MKDILYYTITRSGWSRNSAVFGVTSEGPRGRINGRFMDGFASHTTISFCTGKFESSAHAEAYIDRLNAVRKEAAEKRSPFNKSIAEVDAWESKQIEAILDEAKCNGARAASNA